MQIKQKGFSKNLGIFFIFILSIIPLFYLQNYFNELAERQDSINEELIKEQLLNEMEKFQEDLKPELYIENALKELELKSNFPNFDNKKYKFAFSDDNEPDYIPADFVSKSKDFLKNKYGIVPFLFISSNYDFKDIVIDDPERTLKDDATQKRFLYSVLGRRLKESSRTVVGIIPVLKKNKNAVNKIFNNIKSTYLPVKNGGEYTNAFLLESAKNFSILNNDLSKPKTCSVSFAVNLGNQNTYQYYNPLYFFENNSYKVFGLYYLNVKSSDISIQKFLDNILKNTFNENLKVSRKIIDEPVKSPVWEINENSIIYKTTFPSHFYNLIENHKTLNPADYNKYMEFFEKKSISVSVEKKDLKNDYQEYNKYCEKITYIVIALLLLLFLNSVFRIINPRILLPLKVRAIVFIAVIIPVTGLWFIAILVAEKEQNLKISNVEKLMSQRLSLFEKYKDDLLKETNIQLLDFKKQIADEYYKSSVSNFFGLLKSNRLVPSSKKPIYVGRVILYDKSGDIVEFAESHNCFDIKFSTYSTMYRILNDMHLLDKSTDKNKKNDAQNTYFLAYTGSYAQAYNAQNILARESYIIPSENVSLKYKSSYMLVAGPMNPNNPDSLLYSTLSFYNTGRALNDKLNNEYSSLMSQQEYDANIEYAMFERSEDDFFEITPIDKNYPYKEIIFECAKKVIIKKSSNTEISHSENGIIIKSWRFIPDSTMFFTAVAIIPNTSLSFFSGNSFALLLILYAIFAVIMLSDLLAGALLAPIDALTKFVNEISHGHFNVKTKVETGDEMEELSDSFNKMSEGLCEREKLKRFVSDKLYNSLATPNSNKITSANVTILSSDIRSFTTISEKNEPEAVVTLLNDYFTLMEKSITKYGGSIEKIVGDAISAAFYEEKNPDYALNACKAALEMRESLKHFNEERAKQGLFTIENGIGLATGSVMIGFAGEKARRREFLLMGSILKEAEHLEAMTKTAVASKVFIDKTTYTHLDNRLAICESTNSGDVFYRELSLEQ